MLNLFKRLNLQLFADGGDGGGDGAATTGDNAPDAGEARLLELGVPASKIRKRAIKSTAPAQTVAQSSAQVKAPQQAAAATTSDAPEEGPDEGAETKATAPERMSWDDIMKDPEYQEKMQEVVKKRLKSSKDAEARLQQLAPSIELLARKYGLDADNLDANALNEAISNDDSYYEEKALEMGVDVSTAKLIDKNERDTARAKAEAERTVQEQKLHNHLISLQQQGEELKKLFPNFDLMNELQNPAFARMTAPDVNISVEDAYHAVHRKEIMAASMQATAQKTAQQMSNSIRAGKNRPTENGTSNQAPSTHAFDYAHASKEQRDALKRRIYEAKARGEKLYPGQ